MKIFPTALVLAALSLGSVSAAAPAVTNPEAVKEASPPARVAGARKFVFTYEAGYGEIPKTGRRYDFWTPLPWRDEHQKISDLVIHSPGAGQTTFDPEYGNSIFHATRGAQGGKPLEVKIRFVAERKEVRYEDLTKLPAIPPDPPKNLDRYLKGDRLAPIDGAIKSLAARVIKDSKTDLERARAAFDYVVQTMAFTKSGDGVGSGVLGRTLETKQGNSLDMSGAFVGLARASGVPARVVLGFKVPSEFTQGALTGYHAWAEFYLKGLGWVPVDPADASTTRGVKDAYFGRLDANRLQMSVGCDVVLDPPQQSGPFDFWLYPHAEMDGEKLGHGGYRFTFAPAPKE